MIPYSCICARGLRLYVRLVHLNSNKLRYVAKATLCPHDLSNSPVGGSCGELISIGRLHPPGRRNLNFSALSSKNRGSPTAVVCGVGSIWSNKSAYWGKTNQVLLHRIMNKISLCTPQATSQRYLCQNRQCPVTFSDPATSCCRLFDRNVRSQSF